MRPGIAGSVQVVSSTNGELGPSGDDANLVDRKTGVPLNSQADVEIVDETKYAFRFYSTATVIPKHLVSQSQFVV